MTAKITAYLDRVQALTDAATEGPWIAEYSAEAGHCVIPHDAASTREAVAVTRLYHCDADASLIAASRTDMDVMARALRAVIEAHRPEDACGNPSHTNPSAMCPECDIYCSCGDVYPCPTIRAIEAVIPDA